MRLRVIGLLVVLVLGVTGCDWPMFMHDAAHSGRSPDTSISVANVAAGLPERWQATGTSSSPVVANGVLYIGTSDGRVIALDAAGNTNCGGEFLRTCTPLWETGSADAPMTTTPAVANGVLYVARPLGILAAYNASDQSSCLGAPPVCSPIWTSATASGGFSASPVVAKTTVYEGANDGFVYAYNTVTSCTSGCAPKTKYQTGAAISSSPAVANGVLYVGSADGKLYAFDAAGNTGCSGSPVKTCQPLWTAATGAEIHSSPSVDGGRVFVGSTDWKLYAFDAAGSTGCSGSPRKCTPLWTASTPNNVESSPAVSNNVVYVGTTAGGSNPARLNAFDARGTTNCSGSPRTCVPLWTSSFPSTFGMSPVSVANGVVYTVLITGLFSFTGNIIAFDESAPSARCSGSPKTCTPLWTDAPGDTGVVTSAVVVADGFVYVAGNELHAYSP